MLTPPAVTDRPSSKARVFVVEDHSIVLDGLVDLLSAEPDLEFCGHHSQLRGAVEAASAAAPQVILLDLSLNGEDAGTLIGPMNASLPEVPILVLSMQDEFLYAERMIAEGARGFIGKEQAPDELLRAIRTVLRGQMYMSPAVSERIVKRVATGRKAGVAVPENGLSPREMQVFRMIADGHDLNQIAAALQMGLKTADTHRRNIRSKLGLESSAELQRYAMHWVRSTAAPQG